METNPLLMLATAAALSIGAAAVENVAADALSPGLAEQRAFTLAARGVQIYECRAGAWTFVAPEAELFDARGQAAGHHGAGPFWQARDGSRVVGAVRQRAEAPRAGDIPWLLLAADSRGSTGLFRGVSSIQRVNTRGGNAPAAGCAASGQLLRVPYTGDYHFNKTLDRSQP
jgi:Protein of unknown function (DUF3455)